MTARNILGACLMLGVMAAGLVYYGIKLVVWLIVKRRKK